MKVRRTTFVAVGRRKLIFFYTLFVLLTCVNTSSWPPQSNYNGSSSTIVLPERSILGLAASKLVMVTEVRQMELHVKQRMQAADHDHLQTSDLEGEFMSGSVVHGFYAGYHSVLYYIDMDVGTPPVPTTFVLDTGGSLTWVQCAEVFNEGAPGPLYNKALSSSFSPIPCPSHACSDIPISQGCNDDGECIFALSYFDGSFTRGILGLETFTFDGFTLENTVFGCTQAAAAGLLGPGRGLLGFGAGRHALPMRLQSNIFFCLPIRTLSNYVQPTIAAPGVAGLGDLELPDDTIFTRLIIHDGHHMVPVEGISIDGALLPLLDSDFNDSPDVGAMIDTGAFLSYLLPRAYVVVRDAFREAARNKGLRQVSVDANSFPVDTCYDFGPRHDQGPTLQNTPSIELYFEGDVSLSLHPENIMYRIIPAANVYCLTFAKDPSSMPPLTMLGNLQLASFLVSINTDEMTVAFTPDKC